MNYLHYDVQVGANEYVHVKLDRQANVLLLDSVNYKKYQNQESYEYAGGLVKVSPLNLKPPFPGHWHVVIDLGGYEGEVKVSVNIKKE